MKKAFSLIEVIFVLVILGIVASISSQIIVQVYENYITQRAVYNVSTKTELAINQIVNRLTYSIVDSALAKDPNNASNYKLLVDLDVNVDRNLTILEWVGYDNDSFAAGANPYWSGVANYETATKSAFETPGSDLGKVDTIIQNLSHTQVGLTASTQHPAVVFQPRTGGGEKVNGECMGLIKTNVTDIDNNTSCIYAVSENNASSFSFDDINKSKIITERYQLTWSAYALVPVKQPNGLYNLDLHYNYQPWYGEKYDDGSTSISTLISNISVFKFTQSGGIIQLKLCATENIGQDYNISSCKEKAIIR
jgi:prepilin-type N-terminal cleavage/methylation domain-containing protein